MVCDVNGCKWNDGNGNCNCDGIYISDAETGDPMCMSAVFEEDDEKDEQNVRWRIISGIL